MKTAFPELLSAAQIAARIHRSRQAVRDTIARLKLKPAITVSGGTYYRDHVIPAIVAAMREPNKNGSGKTSNPTTR